MAPCHPASILIALLAVFVGGCVARPTPDTGATNAGDAPPVNTFVYDCGGEYRFTARVGPDSTRLFLPERTVTLPSVVSASGAKYSDGSVTFWTKGEEALLETGETTRRGCGRDAQWEEARRRGVDFRAVGDEPGWYLEIERGKQIRFVTDYGQTRIYTPVPEPETQPRAQRTIYHARTEAHDLRVVITGQPCRGTMAAEAYAAAVTVVLDGREHRGCGLWLAAEPARTGSP